MCSDTDHRWPSARMAAMDSLEDTLIQGLTLTIEEDRHDIVEGFCWLIRKSPKLQRLTWEIDPSFRKVLPMDILAISVYPTGRLNNTLWSLALPDSYFVDSDFKIVVENLCALTRLELNGTGFGDASVKILKAIPRYLTTLEVLNVIDCRRLSSAGVHNIMCSISGLKDLRANFITDTDIAAHCLQLNLAHGMDKLKSLKWLSTLYGTSYGWGRNAVGIPELAALAHAARFSFQRRGRGDIQSSSLDGQIKKKKKKNHQPKRTQPCVNRVTSSRLFRNKHARLSIHLKS